MSEQYWKAESFIQRQKITSILPMFSSLASILGSTYIIYSLIGTKRGRDKKLKTTFNRLLLALSFADIIGSGAQFFTTWTFPKTISSSMFTAEQQEFYHAQFPYTAGNDYTCNTQGFFIQFGLMSSVLFNGFIAIQYVLTVTYQWSEKRMRIVEKIFLMIGTIFPFSFALFLVTKGAIGPTKAQVCWINVKPFFCNPPDKTDDAFCQSLYSFWKQIENYKLFMTTIWIGLVLLIELLSMIILFATVRIQEVKASKWMSDPSQQGRNQKKVVQRALLYIGAFLVVWVPIIIKIYTRDSFLNVIIAVMFPLQGLINAAIFSNFNFFKLCKLDALTKKCFSKITNPTSSNSNPSDVKTAAKGHNDQNITPNTPTTYKMSEEISCCGGSSALSIPSNCDERVT